MQQKSIKYTNDCFWYQQSYRKTLIAAMKRSLIFHVLTPFAAIWQTNAMFLAGITVKESAFDIVENLTPHWRVRSLIECAGHFMITKSRGTHERDANGFSFDNHTGHCKLGNVLFPVEEDPEPGVIVFGIREYQPVQYWGFNLIIWRHTTSRYVSYQSSILHLNFLNNDIKILFKIHLLSLNVMV